MVIWKESYSFYGILYSQRCWIINWLIEIWCDFITFHVEKECFGVFLIPWPFVEFLRHEGFCEKTDVTYYHTLLMFYQQKIGFVINLDIIVSVE